MANTIQIKRSSTASDTPSASDLAVGELAVNTADAKLFTKHTDGTVKELAGGGGGGGGSVALDDITTGDSASTLATSAGNITIDAQGSDTDIIFKGTDGHSDITALTLDMSENGQLQIISTIRHAPSGSDKYTTLSFQNQGQQDQSIVFPNASGTILLNSENQFITGDLTLTSTDGSATEDPNLKLFRNSSSPANSDYIGTIQFQGNNNANQSLVFAEIQSQISDVTDGSEDGVLYFQVRRDGTLTSIANVSGSSGRFNISNGDLFLQTAARLIFEGATSNNNETTLTVTDPTSDNTITLPDSSGTVLTTGNSNTPTTTTSSGDADFVLIDDGGTMKKITPSNLGIGGGGGGGMPTSGGTFTGNVTLGQNVSLLFEGSSDDANEIKLSSANASADRTITLPDQTGTAMVSLFYDSYLSSNQTLSTSYSTIDFDTNRQNSDTAVFSESAGEVTIAKAGVYLISLQLTIGNSSSSRSEGILRLQRKPSGGSFSEVAGATARTYHRNNSQDGSEGSVSLMYSVTAGDVFRVQARRNSGGGSLFAYGDGCRFNIMALKIG